MADLGTIPGASGLQSPLTMPMLELPEVPAVYAGKQVRWLLHWSEIIFPKASSFTYHEGRIEA